MEKGWINKFLKVIEKVGNALPHPATLFGILALLVLIASWVTSMFDIVVIHPGDGSKIMPVNLLNTEGLHKILYNTVTNFTGFAPLGTVLVALLGIGVAEGTGLLSTILRLIVIKAPDRLLTAVVVFSGVLSNAASEIGYVVLVPLAAVIFLAARRHPLAGMAAAFAGVSGGYSANLVIGTIDPLLAGLSTEAAHILDPAYEVSVTSNWYFMVASTFLITGLGTWVTEKIVMPRLGKYEGEIEPEKITNLTKDEKRGLLYASLFVLFTIGIILWGLIPEGSFLRNMDETGMEQIIKSPILKGIVTYIFIAGALAGVFYGIGAKTVKSDNDIMKAMGDAMATLGPYIVLVFFAAQFVEYFKWTNLGLIVAVKGADGLKAFIEAVGAESPVLRAILVMVPFILVSAFINLFMGSASAKWGIMAPVFIPMLMLLGFTPEFTQVAYRVGDSVTNIIAPMMSYFALIIAFMQRYDKKAGIGTLISTMIPYSFIFFIGWSIFLIIWVAFDIPLGPGVGLYLDAAAY